MLMEDPEVREDGEAVEGKEAREAWERRRDRAEEVAWMDETAGTARRGAVEVSR